MFYRSFSWLLALDSAVVCHLEDYCVWTSQEIIMSLLRIYLLCSDANEWTYHRNVLLQITIAAVLHTLMLSVFMIL